MGLLYSSVFDQHDNTLPFNYVDATALLEDSLGPVVLNGRELGGQLDFKHSLNLAKQTHV